MKISDVLASMQLEYSLRGDIEYDETISLDNLDITWIDEQPSDELFHENAALLVRRMLTDKYQQTIQNIIDEKAREKSYQNGFACASYSNSTNAVWKAEAIQFIAWRDSCWEYAYNIQSQVDDGEIELPSLDAFISNIPTLTWS